ncbi:MAG: twin-arginine translocation signal domain-containing protein, partial [Phycisphaerae bacterium]|nr:twin-arginine translocation signal domain-containing protein [Phycisphaerae bacterium]NIP53399.1 twin-arginine translocation signal domain-containing protein [Phycisphaerae bacterium]NIS52392.1 twin-arginine translocation signal domain-containing protein [Phycisphaerae bacterium]NIU09887.1 twin-arginine translocation signal domain-containing protein [Phycisphaerae bacterium]NIU57629.1 twin-arginine translocation signal domain-containing protein [Phycisphaerae bacterium]
MHSDKNCTKSCCSCSMSRRGFLAAAGAMAAATQTSLLDFTSSLFAAEPKSTKKGRVRVVFIRPDIDKYWMGWPGAAYDIKARQKQYTKILTDAVKKLNIDLHITHEPLHTDNLVSAF